MNSEVRRPGRTPKLVYALFSLLILLVMAEAIHNQWQAPVPEFSLDPKSAGVINMVKPGSGAEAAGLRAGDVIRMIDDTPLGWSSLVSFGKGYKAGEIIHLSVDRKGALMDLNVPLVSAGPLILERVIFLSLIVFLAWAIIFIFLFTFFQNTEVRRFSLLAQAAGVCFLLPAVQFTSWYPLPNWQKVFSGLGADFCVLLSFYLNMTYPIKLGSPVLRKIVIPSLYGLGAGIAILWFLAAGGWGFQTGGTIAAGLLLLFFIAAELLLFYSHSRLEIPKQRRLHRLLILGSLLVLGPPIFLYALPRILFYNTPIPGWLAGGCLVGGLLIYGQVTVMQAIPILDQVLNRTVVYFLLFMGIAAILVIPLSYLNQIDPKDWVIHAYLLAGLTLLIAFIFPRLRRRLQQIVDAVFYGSWYDYPKVIKSVSAQLARCLTREQFEETLTRQVPELMNFSEAWLVVYTGDGEPELPGIQPQLQIPLKYEDKLYATWVIGPPLDRYDFSFSDRQIVSTLSPEIEVALSNILHLQKLHEQLDEIRSHQAIMTKMGHQLIRSRDEEQQRLSRELHDGPLQELVGMNLQLGMLLSRIGSEQAVPSIVNTLTSIQQEARSLIAELRQVCSGLRPPILDTLGLSSALRALLDAWAAEEGITIRQELPSDSDLVFVNSEVRMNLYRVVQEALTNIARHASASQVNLVLNSDLEKEELRLNIQDDGKGFDLETVPSQTAENHFGLAGMQERVGLIGGQWNITSSPGCGTRIEVSWRKQDWLDSTEYPSATLVADPGK